MIKFERDDGRYYYMRIERDMFDELVLVVLRGGRHHSIHNRVCSGSIHEILLTIESISRRRLKRGYTLVQN
jgi:hypothetical protein